jgi:hypothetical protein
VSDWSSFKNNKKHSDAWKSFLNEGTFTPESQENSLDEFTGGLKNYLRGRTGGKHNLSTNKNQYVDDLVCKKGEPCSTGEADGDPLEAETYNADDVVALNKAFDDINRLLGLKIDRAALSKELQDLLTDPQGNNYTIEEQAIHKASVILGRMPKLGDLAKYPNLTKLFNGALTNTKTKAHLHKILARGGFFGKDGDKIPDWFEKAPEPTPEPEKEAPEAALGNCKNFKVNKNPASPLMALQMYLLNVKKEYQLNPKKYIELRDYIVKQSVAAGFFSELDAKEIKEVVGQVASTKTPRRQVRPVKGSNSKAAKSRSADLSGIFQIFKDQEIAQSIYDCCKLQLKTSGWNIGQPAPPEEKPKPWDEPHDWDTPEDRTPKKPKPWDEPHDWDTPEDRTPKKPGQDGATPVDVEEIPDEDDSPGAEPQERKVFYLADDFDTNKIKGSWNSVNKRKAGPNINFQSDLDAFVNFIGPYLPENVLSEKKTSNNPVEKIANSNYLIKNKDKILQQFKKLSREDPKKAEKVKRMSRIFMKSQSKPLLNDLMRKVRTKMVSDQGAEVVDLPTTKKPFHWNADRTNQSKVAANKLNESNTIGRWKSLAGIK